MDAAIDRAEALRQARLTLDLMVKDGREVPAVASTDPQDTVVFGPRERFVIDQDYTAWYEKDGRVWELQLGGFLASNVIENADLIESAAGRTVYLLSHANGLIGFNAVRNPRLGWLTVGRTFSLAIDNVPEGIADEQVRRAYEATGDCTHDRTRFDFSELAPGRIILA